jgi:hypothetical protein
MPLNKACIAKQYPPVEATITIEALQKYARAYDHDNPFFFDEHKPGAIIAPPMYGVVPILAPTCCGWSTVNMRWRF